MSYIKDISRQPMPNIYSNINKQYKSIFQEKYNIFRNIFFLPLPISTPINLENY
jgi:hypothetical protein